MMEVPTFTKRVSKELSNEEINNLKGSLVIFPEGGWEQDTWYRGACSMRKGNPKFEVLVFSGRLDQRGMPDAYSGLFSTSYVPLDDSIFSINRPLYLYIREKLFKAESVL